MVDAHEERRSAVAAVLARALPATAPDVPLALAREILDVLPDLHLLDAARDARSAVADMIERIDAELDRRPWDPGLPPPGTTLREALLGEADRLRQNTATMSGGYAVGFGAGREAFLRALQARAATAGAERRPGVPDGVLAPVVPDDRPHDARIALTQRVAELPGDPAARARHRRISVANELIRYEQDTGVRSGELAAAIADMVLATLPEIDTLAEAADALRPLEEDLLARWQRLAVEQAECGITAAETRWRNALARELRHAAGTVTANSGMTDSFTIGYNLAANGLARRVRARADDVRCLTIPI
jgi:hypothetical protein